MSALAEGLDRLKSLLAELEELAITHPVETTNDVLETLELASAFEVFETEASQLLLQTSANLWERLSQHELEGSDLNYVIEQMTSVGFTQAEINHLLVLDDDGGEG